MGTKNHPGEHDCYAKAEPDEPMFVLLARDKHAPALVWLWATLRELDGEDTEKVKEARACTMSMLEWAADHDRKSVGFGQAAMAGVMELIRSVNDFAKLTGVEPKNTPTGDQVIRGFLAVTEFED